MAQVAPVQAKPGEKRVYSETFAGGSGALGEGRNFYPTDTYAALTLSAGAQNSLAALADLACSADDIRKSRDDGQRTALLSSSAAVKREEDAVVGTRAPAPGDFGIPRGSDSRTPGEDGAPPLKRMRSTAEEEGTGSAATSTSTSTSNGVAPPAAASVVGDGAPGHHRKSSRLLLQLTPKSDFVGQALRDAGQNPLLELVVKGEKPVSDVISRLATKWQQARGLQSTGANLVLHSVTRSWTVQSTVGATVAMVCSDQLDMVAGSSSTAEKRAGPRVAKLKYEWAPSATPVPSSASILPPAVAALLGVGGDADDTKRRSEKSLESMEDARRSNDLFLQQVQQQAAADLAAEPAAEALLALAADFKFSQEDSSTSSQGENEYDDWAPIVPSSSSRRSRKPGKGRGGKSVSRGNMLSAGRSLAQSLQQPTKAELARNADKGLHQVAFYFIRPCPCVKVPPSKVPLVVKIIMHYDDLPLFSRSTDAFSKDSVTEKEVPPSDTATLVVFDKVKLLRFFAYRREVERQQHAFDSQCDFRLVLRLFWESGLPTGQEAAYPFHLHSVKNQLPLVDQEFRKTVNFKNETKILPWKAASSSQNRSRSSGRDDTPEDFTLAIVDSLGFVEPTVVELPRDATVGECLDTAQKFPGVTNKAVIFRVADGVMAKGERGRTKRLSEFARANVVGVATAAEAVDISNPWLSVKAGDFPSKRRVSAWIADRDDQTTGVWKARDLKLAMSYIQDYFAAMGCAAVVQPEQYDRFLKHFGPISGSLERVMGLFESDSFQCEVSKIVDETLSDGSYIIELSDEPGTFIVSAKTPSQIKQYKLEYHRDDGFFHYGGQHYASVHEFVDMFPSIFQYAGGSPDRRIG